MLSKKLLFVCVSCLTLAACSADEIASVNRQISDGAFALTGALRGNSSSADSSGMPVLSQAQKPATKSRTQEYSVPVDVDTAAARLKRYYEFISFDEIEAIRKKNTSGEWAASAILEQNPVWEVMPGSYYKMGQNWDDYDHLTIEEEKNGAGSKLYITFKSPSDKRLNSESLRNLMSNIKDVAEGKIR